MDTRVLKYNSNQTCFPYSNLSNGGNEGMENKKKNYEKQGNPYKRGNTWTYVYYITDNVTGEKKQKRKGGFATKKEAELALKETEALIITSQYIEDKKMTLGQYIKHWFNDIHKPNLQPNTINGYEVNIKNHIIPSVGNIQLVKLNRNDIICMCNSMREKGLSPRTVKYVFDVLRKSLKEAVLSDLILKNPCDNVTLPKQRKYHAIVLTSEQIKTLLMKSIDSDVELEVLIAITLGLRRGEVLGLRFSDFDFENQTVHIQQQVTTVRDKTIVGSNEVLWGLKDLKTEDSNRTIYVPQSVMEAVERRKKRVKINKLKYGAEYKDYDLVCCMENGMYYSPQTVYHRFKRLLKECGLPDCRFTI